ncbi:hypothetical protein V1477_011998 [Vespula maculifrons]|uniref:Uncharacterized protein n=1 Tax=Vespula maculifrons TaxID=7453 RepID=A0ABD2C0S9_VESMC
MDGGETRLRRRMGTISGQSGFINAGGLGLRFPSHPVEAEGDGDRNGDGVEIYAHVNQKLCMLLLSILELLVYLASKNRRELLVIASAREENRMVTTPLSGYVSIQLISLSVSREYDDDRTTPSLARHF